MIDAKEGRLVENLVSFAVNTARRTEDGGMAGGKGVMMNQVDELPS